MLFLAVIYTGFIKSLCPVWKRGDKPRPLAYAPIIPAIPIIHNWQGLSLNHNFRGCAAGGGQIEDCLSFSPIFTGRFSTGLDMGIENRERNNQQKMGNTTTTTSFIYLNRKKG
jgi:hypothetical protein